MFTAFQKRSFPYNYELNKYCMDSTQKSIKKMTREYEEERKQNKCFNESINSKQNDIHNLSEYVGFLSAACFLLNFIFIRK